MAAPRHVAGQAGAVRGRVAADLRLPHTSCGQVGRGLVNKCVGGAADAGDGADRPPGSESWSRESVRPMDGGRPSRGRGMPVL